MDKNIEFVKVAEFDTLPEAKNYCKENTMGLDEVGDYDNCTDGNGRNFHYEVFDGEPYILDEDGELVKKRESLYETEQYYFA